MPDSRLNAIKQNAQSKPSTDTRVYSTDLAHPLRTKAPVFCSFDLCCITCSMIILSSNRWRKSDFCGECRTLDLATLIWHNYRTFTYLSSFNTFINEIICLFWLIKWTWYSVLGLFPSICENFHKLRAHVNFLLAHFVLTTALKLKIGEMLNASCSVHIYIGRAILRNAQCSAKFSLIVCPALEVRAKCNSYA